MARQTDPEWTLTIAVRDTLARRCRLLAWSLGWQLARRVRIVTGPPQASPRDIFELGVSAEGSSLIALVFPGDLWARDAVALIAAGFVSDDVVYADEDRVDAGGRHCDPRLKPRYSPDFLMGSAYVGRPLAFRAQLLDGFDPVADGLHALEHEYGLHVCATAASVRHVPEVLCHRTGRRTTGAEESGHVVAALRRRGDPSDVHAGRSAGTFHIVRRSLAPTRVSVVIPFATNPSSCARASIPSVPPPAAPTSSSCWSTTARRTSRR